MGGIQINENAQVMHLDGYPIRNLYAAGEITGGIHGGDRLGSCATLDCLLFGRVAGKSFAENWRTDRCHRHEFNENQYLYS